MVYYGVRGGPCPGVYTTWDEASKFSQGRPGALCKKFKDQESAVAFAGSRQGAVSSQSQADIHSKSIFAANGMTASRSGPSKCSVLSERTYLEVPFAQKDAAKALGAKWDAERKKWFAESGVVLAALSRWLPGGGNHSVAPLPPASNCSSACRTYLEVPFAENETAKASGAKWDPERKKWFAESAPAPPALSRWLPHGAHHDGPDSACPVPSKEKKKRLVSELFLPSAEHKALAELQPDELALFTDGACKGNNHVTASKCPAGWGVAVVGGGGADGSHAKGTAQLVAELFGPVVIDSASPFFLGAEVGSNNTGELSGICEALLWLIHYEPSSRSAAIFYDSKYAAKITTGEYRAEKNKSLAAKARSLLQSARQHRKVRFEHVKGHSNNRWNDAADGLANRGAAGETCSIGRYGRGDGAASQEQPQAKRARLGA